MRLVLIVPNVVCANLMSEWCNPKDLTKFDTACCNHQCRPILLTIMEKSWFRNAFEFNKGQSYCHRNFDAWLRFRNLKCSSLYFGGESFDLNYILPPTVVKTEIECLHFEACKIKIARKQFVADLINSFPNLSSLIVTDCRGFNDGIVTNISTDILIQLKHLVIIASKTRPLTHHSICYLSIHCSDLITLGLKSYANSNTLCEFVSKCPNLKDLYLECLKRRDEEPLHPWQKDEIKLRKERDRLDGEEDSEDVCIFPI